MKRAIEIFQRYRTLVTHRIHRLPVVILMPHSACNCRCVMCDIWKDNKSLKQLNAEDITPLLTTLEKYRTQVVVMSGGEALLNRNFFRLCELFREKGIKVTLLSTGLTLKQHAEQIVKYVNEVVVSLDGDENVHDAIRRIPNAFSKLSEGVRALKELDPEIRITARTVIQKENFRIWPQIVQSAKNIGIDQISFLPADVFSTAFNRTEIWEEERRFQVQPDKEELGDLKEMLHTLFRDHSKDFSNGFIAESPEKLLKIWHYYSARYGLNAYPYKKCNAPWVSTVIEADGTLRHCFFQESMGNIKDEQLDSILNGKRAISFRRSLDTQKDETCMKCVCYLNLAPRISL